MRFQFETASRVPSTGIQFHLHVIPRFKDQPGKDAIGLPWDSVPGNLDEIERIGNHLS